MGSAIRSLECRFYIPSIHRQAFIEGQKHLNTDPFDCVRKKGRCANDTQPSFAFTKTKTAGMP